MSAVHYALLDGYQPETWVVELREPRGAHGTNIYLAWVRSRLGPPSAPAPSWAVLADKKRVRANRVAGLPLFSTKEEAFQAAEVWLRAMAAAWRLG